MEDIQRAKELQLIGFRPYDALYIACAENYKADVLLTTDDKLFNIFLLRGKMRKPRKNGNSKYPDDDKLPLKLLIRKYKMLFLYRFRVIRKRIPTIYIISTTISIILFISVLIPNMFHRLPILCDWPMVFELSGYIQVMKNNQLDTLPSVGTLVEIGGYNTVTDHEGKFQIKFVSKHREKIPIIIRWSQRVEIRAISFDSNQYKKTEVFVLK